MDTLFGFDDLAENRKPATYEIAPSQESAELVRPQVISRIIELNPTASAAFLDQFSDNQLRFYLDHLRSAEMPRRSARPWVRPGDAPAVTGARSVA
ncbi:MAG: hypothetical protein ACIAQ0_04945 [Phycisphaerales bacterium JB058]|jgi:hypothetical protein